MGKGRRFGALLFVASVLAAGFFVSVSDPAAALARTWTTNQDFAGGDFLATEVIGSGPAAAIQLQVNPMYNWNRMDPPAAPTPRRGAAMAYDEEEGVILMFGGVDANISFLNDLWAYNVPTNTWTNITPTASPPPRWKAGFSYDPVERAVVMTGGADGNGTRTDLWWYYVTNGTWQQLLPIGPVPRNLLSTPLIYDTAAERHILAGADTARLLFETWSYDVATNRWTNLDPPDPVPPLTEGHTLAYDRFTDKVILFGGGIGLQVYGDLWEYNYMSNRWRLEVPFTPNVTPNPRTDHAMIFGPYRAVSIMYGGIDGSGAYQPETWYYVSAVHMWSQPAVSIFPIARKDHALAWDSTRDRTIMFGGIISDGVVTNQTWMWGPGYYASGRYTSTTFDAGCSAPTWQTLWWNATMPPRTRVRFKIATSSSPDGPFTFEGWDGLPGTYYNGTPGQSIWSGHNRPPVQRYLRWMAALTQGAGNITPALDDLTLVFACADHLPYITSTVPANFASFVQLNAAVVVSFSEPMNESTVTWTFSDPAVSFTPSWDPTDTTLTLKHATPFKECATQQRMEIFGKDQYGVSLVPGPVPNPWTFNTGCFPPKITQTTPADGDFNVAVTAPLVVQFSEPMNISTVSWSFSDPSIPFTPGWDATETNLTLSHSPPLAQCTIYTAQIRGGKDKVGLNLVSGPVPNPWTFTTDCPNPYVARTSPVNGAPGVPMIAPIVVTFSKPMDLVSVNLTITPSVALTRTWSGGDTVLTLDHTVPLAEFTRYTVNITAGKEKGGLPLVSGPVPNPWRFQTERVWPKVNETTPADGAIGVPLDANIVVTFSEAMDTATVDAQISPAVPLTKVWNPPENTVLTLTHAMPFAPCTQYAVNVSGKDLQGLPLVPGPVPTPWSFQTACPLQAPAHLSVSLAGPDVRLVWDPVPRSSAYRVYSSPNRFQPWPWAIIGTTLTPSFLVLGHGSDLQTHQYIVRATNGTGDGANSTMGVKTTLQFVYSAANTNVAWFSLPYRSSFARASDIARALGPANIDVVGRWVPSQQSSVVYYYARDGWRGTDFPIKAGDGLYLGTRRAFAWNITGTDASVSRSFTWNAPPRGNVNWIGVPYTGIYARASDVANALGPSRTTEVGLWDPVTQSVVRWYWTGSMWTGTDFSIAPGSGTYIVVASSFAWTPALITPTVP